MEPGRTAHPRSQHVPQGQQTDSPGWLCARAKSPDGDSSHGMGGGDSLMEIDGANVRKLRVSIGIFRISGLFSSPFSHEPICTPTKGFSFTVFLIFENAPFCVIIDCFGQFARLIIMDALKTVVILFRIKSVHCFFQTIGI